MLQSSPSSQTNTQPQISCQIRSVGLDCCSTSDLPRVPSLPQASNISIHIGVLRSPQNKICSSEPSLTPVVVRCGRMWNSKLLQGRLSIIGCQPRAHQLRIVCTSLLRNIQMFASLSWRSSIVHNDCTAFSRRLNPSWPWPPRLTLHVSGTNLMMRRGLSINLWLCHQHSERDGL